MDKRENKRNWYLQIQAAFFDDSDYKRFRRRLPPDVQDGTAIYLKMILLAIKDGETKNAEDVTLSFFHDEDSFSEEIAYAINEDPMEVKAVIDTMLKCHILEEVQPDTWQIHFPDGTIGSITDSSLRSRKSREKRRMLQCNTNATQEQHESNLYNSNRNNNSYSQIDSNNHINLTTITKDTETENSASGFDSAEGGPAVASAAGAAPRPAPDSDLFTLDQLKRCIKKNKVNLTDEGAEAFLDEMHKNGWTLYSKPVEKKNIVRVLRAWAKYTWTKSNHVTAKSETELEDIKKLTNSELMKMFPDCTEWSGNKNVFWSEGFEALTSEATTHPHDRKEESEWYEENGDRNTNNACMQIWSFYDQIMEIAYKYIDSSIMWDEELVDDSLTIILKDAGIIPKETTDFTDIMDRPEILPLFCPYKAFTTEQRRFLYTAYGVRFPVNDVKLLNGHRGGRH